MINILSPHGIRLEPRFNSKQYLAWIAGHKCLICGGTPEVSHTVPKSMGNRASDVLTLPLCYNHHRGNDSIHKLGIEGFEAKHKIDLNSAVWQFINRYCQERGVKLADRLVLFLEQTVSEL